MCLIARDDSNTNLNFNGVPCYKILSGGGAAFPKSTYYTPIVMQRVEQDSTGRIIIVARGKQDIQYFKRPFSDPSSTKTILVAERGFIHAYTSKEEAMKHCIANLWSNESIFEALAYGKGLFSEDGLELCAELIVCTTKIHKNGA